MVNLVYLEQEFSENSNENGRRTYAELCELSIIHNFFYLEIMTLNSILIKFDMDFIFEIVKFRVSKKFRKIQSL